MKENTPVETIHKFESAGLGKAPFKYVGYEYKTYQACPGAPIQVGGSCEYCGTGIKNFYYIKSSDGKLSHVGSECINKVGDAGLKKVVKEVERENNRKKAIAKKVEARETLAALLEEYSFVFEASPHPNSYLAEKKGLTLLDYYQFVLKSGGSSGAQKAVRAIKKMGISSNV